MSERACERASAEEEEEEASKPSGVVVESTNTPPPLLDGVELRGRLALACRGSMAIGGCEPRTLR